MRNFLPETAPAQMPAILTHLITTYGYWMVAALVCVESFGVPVPGETALIVAGAYAATSHKMDVWWVVASAAGGGILGDNLGYWLGRRFGYWLVLRYGHYVWLTEARIKVGQYLFLCHGRRVVFVGRFLPVLRELAAFLAGMNQMRWEPFLLANASGSLLWAAFYGFGAFWLGKSANGATEPVQIGIGAVAGIVFLALATYLYLHEKRLEVEAEHALPGPLHRTGFWRRRSRA